VPSRLQVRGWACRCWAQRLGFVVTLAWIPVAGTQLPSMPAGLPPVLLFAAPRRTHPQPARSMRWHMCSRVMSACATTTAGRLTTPTT
jgi:hypothetical protein